MAGIKRNVHFPEGMRERIYTEAARDGRSFNGVVTRAIDEYLKSREDQTPTKPPHAKRLQRA